MSAIELTNIMFFCKLEKKKEKIFLEDNIHLNFRVSVFVSFVVCLFLFSFHLRFSYSNSTWTDKEDQYHNQGYRQA